MPRQLLLCVAFSAALAMAFISTPSLGDTKGISSSSVQGNDDSCVPSISADGRYVAFESFARNLVPGDTNGRYDIFVHDRVAGTTECVSLSSSGVQANHSSDTPSISADGRYVVFGSKASNLIPGDTNDCPDIFVHDRVAGKTTRVSVSSFGDQGDRESGRDTPPSISADGRYVAFDSLASNLVADDANGDWDVFVRDCVKGHTERISISSSGEQGDGDSYSPFLSADGRCVAFYSLFARNLVHDDTNGKPDVFVHDRVTGETVRVSISSSGEQGDGNSGDHDPPSISADGRYVTFESKASNLVPGDTNGYADVFVHDRGEHETTRVSVPVSTSGVQTGKRLNCDTPPVISADGRYVAFDSMAPNLVPGDTNSTWDVFVYDRVTGQTERVSVSSSGKQGNLRSYSPSISADGRYVVYESDATDLVPHDTNGNRSDILLHDRVTMETVRVSVSSSVPTGQQ